MKFKFYVNPIFIRNGEKNVKIMVNIEQIGFYGIFYNVKTKKIQRQVYNGQKSFDWKNVYGNGNPYNTITSFQQLQNTWNMWDDETKEAIYIASCYLYKALLKFFNDTYILQKNLENKDDIRMMTHYINQFIKGLYENNPIAINQNYENGFYTTETIKTESEPKQKTETRKSIAMFKLINADNFANLFEGNIYPIIKHENGYYTIKDDNGNDCIIRANRGKEIKVFIEL